jgi:uncharacterized membrane-anchored protein
MENNIKIQRNDLRALLTILKAVLIIAVVAVISGVAANYFGSITVVSIAVLVALKFGLSIFIVWNKHVKEDRDANQRMNLGRAWTSDEIKLRKKENDTALKNAFVVLVCGMVVYAFLFR